MKTRLLCLVLCCCLVTGCFGTFPATNKFKDINRGAGGTWTQSMVFAVMLPLYAFGIASDLIVLNPYETWFGAGEGE